MDFKQNLNPDSLTILDGCVLEPGLAQEAAGKHYQFERQGYFYADPLVAGEGGLVFNRTVGLRDTWAKLQA